MSTQATPQIHPDSLDIDGLSVSTASPSATDSRYGTIYEPQNLFAAAPVFFHHLSLTSYLAVFSERWTAADPTAGSTPGYSGTYTVDDLPSWVKIEATTGSTSVAGSGGAPYTIPTMGTYDTRKLQAATARMDFLYLLSTVTVDSVDSALVQHFRKTYNDQMILQAEEIVPTITADSQTVLFNRGLYWDSQWIYFFGSGSSDNAVYMARKKWPGIGSNTNPAAGDYLRASSTPIQWEYQHDTGWSTDPSEISKVLTSDGTALTTRGPIGTAQYKDRVFISPVVASGSARSAQVYNQRISMAWTPLGSPVALGTSGTTYMGGTLYFQAQLGADPNNDILTNPANVSAFPSVISKKDTVTSEDAINVTWSLWPVTRLA